MSIESDELIKAKLSDAVKMTELKSIPSFLGFLNEREFSICKSILDKSRIKFIFSGGYPDAVRQYIAILPDWADKADFPFKTLCFKFNKVYSLSHRDFLGTLMSLGIERSKVGDIIVKEGCAYAFVSDSVVSFCVENITKVGGVGVELSITDYVPDTFVKFDEISKTIASDRADCVVGAVCNLSREKAKAFILSGNLIVNHIVCESITMRINTGDVLSVRGAGKYIVDSIDNKTKKGRLKLILKKYI